MDRIDRLVIRLLLRREQDILQTPVRQDLFEKNVLRRLDIIRMHHLFDTPQFIKPFRVQKHDTIKWRTFHFIEVDSHITAHKPVTGSCFLTSHYHGLCIFPDAGSSFPDLSLRMLPGVDQRHELHHQLYFYKVLYRQIIGFPSGDLTHISDLVQTAC